jgi:hypothetical protein
MDWLHHFWTLEGESVIAGIAIIVGASIVAWLLLRAFRVMALILGSVLRFLCWALIGWWSSKVRRWITGAPW